MVSPGAILKKIRALMTDKKHVPEVLQAYIIPSTDAHMSDYSAERDKRREFVSGFTGSTGTNFGASGTAVITMDKALLWVDSRFYTQAEKQVDPSLWTIMKDDMADVLALPEWLAKKLPAKSKIGVDPTLISTESWNELTKSLVTGGHTLIAVPQNLVDLVWDKQPGVSKEPIHLHPLELSGKAWRDKVEDVRNALQEVGADVLIVTELDEIAWLFNLRGNDIEFNPVFFAYAAITMKKKHLFVDVEKLEVEAKFNLTRPHPQKKSSVVLHPYGDIADFIAKQVEEKKTILICPRANVALTSLIPSNLVISALTPIATLKSIKNPVERRGMRRAHIRDGAAMVQFLAWLEFQIKHNRPVTEISAADKIEEFRRLQERFVGLSFATFSSVGPNAALPLHIPDSKKVELITKEAIYLVNSGTQYLDGTTDITRTVHLGTPTEFEKEAFTRVLKGHIAITSALFPNKTKGLALDVLARQFLWAKGLNYGHGTGYGIGSYLSVHEGPCGISHRPLPDDPGLQEGMFLTNEPGYYKDGHFGIRIGNVVEVVKAKSEYKFQGKGFLAFEVISFCPIQQSLIEPSLMTADEIEWLNHYHSETRERLGPLLRVYGDDMALDWLEKHTRPMN